MFPAPGLRLAVVAAALTALAGDVSAAEPTAKSVLVTTLGAVAVGKPAPSFGGFLLDGQLTSLKDLLDEKSGPKGPLVVSFFQTTCAPCLRGMPITQKVVEDLKDLHADAVMVAYAQDTDTVQPFVTAQKLRLKVIVDVYGKVGQRMGVDTKLPRTFVLDQKGVVRAIFETEGADYEAQLRAALEGAVLGAAAGATAPGITAQVPAGQALAPKAPAPPH